MRRSGVALFRGRRAHPARGRDRHRRDPGPESDSPVRDPRGHVRRRGLSRAERPGAGARPRAQRKRIRRDGQCGHQGRCQSGRPMPIGPGGDEVRAAGLHAGRREHAQRQECQQDSCREGGLSLGAEKPRHCTAFLGIDRSRSGRGASGAIEIGFINDSGWTKWEILSFQSLPYLLPSTFRLLSVADPAFSFGGCMSLKTFSRSRGIWKASATRVM